MGLFDFFNKQTDNILGVEFPKFNGQKTFGWPKETNNYKRKDYYYKQDSEKVMEYISLINSYGFSRVNDKKYQNDNSYIIIEEIGNRLHIAFHVNK